MFYSQFILAKKGPLGTIWIAAHLERKLRKNQVTETNISVSVDSILFPEVPIALRLSGHLLLGVVRIYSRKVNYLFHDCSEALVKIKQAFHAGAVDLPPEAATAPFHSITLPETFDLDEFEPLLDKELNLLHSNGGVDHHVSSREQITLQDPLEDSSYLGSQFELDERFPEADAPRLGLDFDEDLLDKPTRETSPAAVILEDEEEMALEEDVIPTTSMDAALDYDQMDRMDALDDIDDHQEPMTPGYHQEPVTPGLSIDHMDLDYQQEVEGLEFDQSHRSPEELEQLEPDFRLENDELDNEQVGVNQLAHQEPVTPGSPAPETEYAKDEYRGPHDEQLEGEQVEQEEGEVERQDLEFGAHKQAEEEALERELEEETFKRDVEEQIFGKDVQEDAFDKEMEQETVDRYPEEETVTREEEDVTFEHQEGKEEAVAEKHAIGVEEEQVIREEVERDRDLLEDAEEQKEVPEYETVMSAPEVTIQERDVFDMDNDMNSEQVAAMDYQDRDVVMEDRDLVLEEEAVPDLHEEGPQAVMAEPESPRYPAISSEDLPGDDDVLATLLGRGTPALKVQQTPAETPAAKPRKRQNLRKRKIIMDMATILGAEVMKQQLMNTDDIRRVRRKAPCTRQELWSVQKDTLSIFCETSVPGLCIELRRLFEQVYVVGEAKLPLAEAIETEVVASEEVRGPPFTPLVEDLNADLNVMVDQPAEVAVVEDEVQVPTHEYQQADVEDVVASDSVAEGSLNVPTEAGLAEDRHVASPTSAPEEPAPNSPLKEAATDIIEAEVKAVDLNDESLDLTAGMEMPPVEYYHPPVVITEEIPREEKEIKQMVEEVNAPELVYSVAEPEPEPTIVPTAETEIEGDFIPVADLQSEAQIEGGIAAVADLQSETQIEGGIAAVADLQSETQIEGGIAAVADLQAEADARAGAKVEVETGTQLIAEAETVMDVEGEVEPLEAPQEGEFEETKVQEEEPIALISEEEVDRRIATPSVGVEVEHVEEQPEEEELGFLADTRDTEFLGADDDDLVEEAEDLQDAKDYGRKESLQDNSGWSARTRAVGHYLRVTLEDKAAYMKKRQEEGTAKLGLERMLVGKSRKEAARMFFETLVLKTKDYIHVEQAAPYGDIQISARPKLLKAKF